MTEESSDDREAPGSDSPAPPKSTLSATDPPVDAESGALATTKLAASGPKRTFSPTRLVATA